MSEFKQPIDSFKEFRAAVEASSGIFQRDALKALYPFFTEEDDSASRSFKVTRSISVGDYHQLWHAVHAGATAAIRSVRAEFAAKPTTNKVSYYLEALLSGQHKTQLLLSVKGTHWPMHPVRVAGSRKC